MPSNCEFPATLQGFGCQLQKHRRHFEPYFPEVIMQDVLMAAVIFSAFVLVITNFFDYRIRRLLVKEGHVDKNVKNILSASPPRFPKFDSLKWGMVIAAIGLAMILIQIFPHTFHQDGGLGLVLLFAGAALLLNYRIDKRRQAKAPAADVEPEEAN